MPIVRAKTRIEEYAARARSSDTHDVTGRTGDHEATKKMAGCCHERLRVHVPHLRSKTILDVGCGDGEFLMSCPQDNELYGLLPSVEEVTTVSKRLQNLGCDNIKIILGRSDDIGLADQSVDVLVCNSVIHILDEAAIERTLAMFRRLSKPRGTILYLGEIPFVDERPPVDYGDSITAYLIHLLKAGKFIRFGAEIRKILTATLGTSSYYIIPKNLKWFDESSFRLLIEANGFVVKDVLASPTTPNTRKDYICVS